MDVTKPYEFIRFGAMDVTKPYEFITFGAMDVTKPYELICFGPMEVTKPYEIIGFGDVPQGPDRNRPKPQMARGKCPSGPFPATHRGRGGHKSKIETSFKQKCSRSQLSGSLATRNYVFFRFSGDFLPNFAPKPL